MLCHSFGQIRQKAQVRKVFNVGEGLGYAWLHSRTRPGTTVKRQSFFLYGYAGCGNTGCAGWVTELFQLPVLRENLGLRPKCSKVCAGFGPAEGFTALGLGIAELST